MSKSGSFLKSFSGAPSEETPLLVTGSWGADVDDGVVAALLGFVATFPLPALPPSGVATADARYSPPAISICVLPIKSDMAETRRRISFRLTRLFAAPPLERDPDLLFWWPWEPPPLELGLPCPLSGTSLDRDRVMELSSSRASLSFVYWLRPFFLWVGRPPLDLDCAIAGAEVGGGVSGDGWEGRGGAERGAAAGTGVADREGALVGVAEVFPLVEAVAGVAMGSTGADVVRVATAARVVANGASSDGSESVFKSVLCFLTLARGVVACIVSLPSTLRRSARPLRLLAASARCRSFSSLSTRSRCACERASAALREAFLEDPLRVAIASSESSAMIDLSPGGDTDRELVRCRFVMSAFLFANGVSILILLCCWCACRHDALFQGGDGQFCLLFAVASTALWPSRSGVRRIAAIFPAGCKGNEQLFLIVGSVPTVHR